MRQRLIKTVATISTLAVILLFIGTAAAEVRAITTTGEYRMGDNDTRTDAKRLALLDAKRLALEQAGTYIESITEVKNFDLSKEEIRAYMAGIVEVIEHTTRTSMEGETTVVLVRVTVKIDTDVVVRQIEALRRNEAARTELLRLRAELDQFKKKLDDKTQELSALRSKAEAELVAKERQHLLTRLNANELFQRAWVVLKGNRVRTFRGKSRPEDRELARALTRQALLLDASDRGAHLLLGIILDEEGKYKDAVEEFRLSLGLMSDLSPTETAVLHTLIGRALLSFGDIEGAVIELQTVVLLDPKYAGGHFGLASVHQRKGNVDQAIEEYRISLRLQPGNPDAHLMLGALLQEKGERDQALDEFLTASRLNPDENLTLAAMMVILADESTDTDIEINKFRRKLRQVSEDAGGHAAVGMALSSLGILDKRKTAEAILTFREALRLRPDYALAHYHLGIALWKTGEKEEGIVELRKARELNPEEPLFHNLGARLMLMDKGH